MEGHVCGVGGFENFQGLFLPEIFGFGVSSGNLLVTAVFFMPGTMSSKEVLSKHLFDEQEEDVDWVF